GGECTGVEWGGRQRLLMRCSECGNPCKVVPFRGGGGSKKNIFRNGARSIKGHDLCSRCWERLNDQFRKRVFNMTLLTAENPYAAHAEKSLMLGKIRVENMR